VKFTIFKFSSCGWLLSHKAGSSTVGVGCGYKDGDDQHCLFLGERRLSIESGTLVEEKINTRVSRTRTQHIWFYASIVVDIVKSDLRKVPWTRERGARAYMALRGGFVDIPLR